MLSSAAVEYSKRLLEAAVCLTHPPVTEDIQILFTDKLSSNRGTCVLKGNLCLFRSFEKQINVSSLLSLSLSPLGTKHIRQTEGAGEHTATAKLQA
jgi:hypothetical protein